MKTEECKHQWVVNTGVVLTSYPPKYTMYCEKCHKVEYIFCSDIGKYNCKEVTFADFLNGNSNMWI